MFKRFSINFFPATQHTRRRQARPPMLNFETLEDRRLLATFTVTNNGDGPVSMAGDLPGSLRQAIFDANTITGGDTISFEPSIFTGGNSSLIRLTAGELKITEALLIDGGTGTGVTITGDANGDDITLTGNITDVDASFGGTAGLPEDLLDDNSRVLKFSAFTGDLTLIGLTVTGGRTTDSGGNGGGISSPFGAVMLINSTVSGNSTSARGSDGGGISTAFGGVMVTNSTVSGNRASGDFANGGGISTASRSAVMLTNSTVSGNTTSGYGALGGGIATAFGAVTLTNSTVSGNTTTGNRAAGAGIGTTTGTVTLNNSTVSGNATVGSESNGGGIRTSSGAVTLIHSTVSDNEATGAAGGGIFVANNSVYAPMTIQNSIVAANRDSGAAPDLSTDPGGVLTVSNSLIGATDLTISGTGNQIGTLTLPIDPLISPLAFNGGATQTQALLPGSPAMDAANPTLVVDLNGWPLVKDQRGFSRVVDGDNNGTATADMGAYEFGGTSPLLFPVITFIERNEGDVVTRPDRLSTYAVTFDVDVSVHTEDLVIRNNTLGGTEVDTAGLTIRYNQPTKTAEWNFGSLNFEPGFYAFELSDNIISVVANLSLDGDFDGNPSGVFVKSVYVALPGDANLDGTVDVLGDAALLVNNLGTTAGAVWEDGDFNGDGAVDVLGDAAILVNRLGQSVVPPMTAQSSVSTLASAANTTDLESVAADQEDDRQRSYLPLPTNPLSLAGSQTLDAAFESSNLIDDGLF